MKRKERSNDPGQSSRGGKLARRVRGALKKGTERGQRGIRRLPLAGRLLREREEEPEKVTARAKNTLKRLGNRGRESLSNLRERLPGRVHDVGEWTAERFAEHPLAFAAGAISAGIAAASMVPISDGERMGLSRAAEEGRGLVERGGVRTQFARLRTVLRERLEQPSGDMEAEGEKEAEGEAGKRREATEEQEVIPKPRAQKRRAPAGKARQAKAAEPGGKGARKTAAKPKTRKRTSAQKR